MDGGQAAAFHGALAASELFQRYQRLARRTHRVSLRILPVSESPPPERHIPNSFCRLAARHPVLAPLCRRNRCALQQDIRVSKQARSFRCHAGLTEIGIPIVADGIHVSTLVAGRVLDHAPSKADLCRIEKLLGTDVSPARREKLRQALLRTPTIEPKDLKKLTQWLEFAAEHLAGRARSILLRGSGREPALVKRTKELIARDLTSLHSIRRIAQKLHCSPDYLERAFKAHTGARLRDFMSMARVEKARQLLSLNRASIASVAYDSGFGSLSQFNRMFKRITGKSPKQWRAATLVLEIVQAFMLVSGFADACEPMAWLEGVL